MCAEILVSGQAKHYEIRQLAFSEVDDLLGGIAFFNPKVGFAPELRIIRNQLSQLIAAKANDTCVIQMITHILRNRMQERHMGPALMRER